MKRSVLAARSASALLLLLSISGCAGSPIIRGEVYDKRYEAEESSVVMLPIVTSSGKTPVTTLIPVVVHDDEQWIVCIRRWNEAKQRFETNQLSVTADCYEQVTLGDWFSRDEDGGAGEDPHSTQLE